MAKWTRITDATADGWNLKSPEDTEANALTASEVDGNWLQLEVDQQQIGTAEQVLKTEPLRAGWLVLDGSTFNSSTYPTLYSLLGNSNVLPDLSADASDPSLEWRIKAG